MLNLRVFFCILIMLSCAACSLQAADDGRVIVVIAGGISIRDLSKPGLHYIERMFKEGASGLMNVRTGRGGSDMEAVSRRGIEEGCLTLGAGAPAVGGAEVWRAANIDGLINGMPAAAIYERHTGIKPRNAKIVHTEIVKIQRINESAAYRAKARHAWQRT